MELMTVFRSGWRLCIWYRRNASYLFKAVLWNVRFFLVGSGDRMQCQFKSSRCHSSAFSLVSNVHDRFNLVFELFRWFVQQKIAFFTNEWLLWLRTLGAKTDTSGDFFLNIFAVFFNNFRSTTFVFLNVAFTCLL